MSKQSKQKKQTQGSKSAQPKQPPQPPEIEKKALFHREQWIGIPLLMLLPLLALFGVFGESRSEAEESNEVLAVHVEYPTRNRYALSDSLEVEIENRSAQEPISVTVKISEAYISNFTGVTFEPSVEQISDGFYEVEAQAVEAGETRLVSVELKAWKYGRHEGQVIVTAEGASEITAITIPIHTFIFP